MKKSTFDRMAVHRFIDNIYNAEVWFFHQGTPKDVEAYLQKKLKTSQKLVASWDWRYDGGATVIENATEKRMIYVVWIRNRRAHYTLHHECFHLATSIFRDRGILLDFTESGHEEHFAYYLDALFKALWRMAHK